MDSKDTSHHLLRVLVGPDHREFVVHRALLCASSTFFADSLEAVPEGLSSPRSLSSEKTPVLWLAGESADVFELFVLWLYRRHTFQAVVEDAVTILAREAEPKEVIQLLPEEASEDGTSSQSSTPSLSPSSSPLGTPGTSGISASRNLSNLHWHLVHLHLFAALVDIPVLQDAVMDALQDLYLRFDWAATPALLTFLYVDADAFAACRLRKWAVALLAWTIANADDATENRLSALARLEGSPPPAGLHDRLPSGRSSGTAALQRLARLPALHADYSAHRRKMQASRADVRIKNPQLRIPSNHLRREDRHFGFRQCSFHSHRRAAGEGRCPHERARREHQKSVLITPVDTHKPFVSMHSPSSSLSSTSSEPRLVDLPVWSPLSVTTPGYAPLGMESTI
ncbi:hypothetical protein SEUCBS139899_000187 [Sporothrix eucalyptigena]|uniref:BTB domain-containing protein n=1 Tax=Sporothrix eucalyptigena TaxID=1812306 RepID=A0ABP0C681_9PEZI